MIEDRCAEGVKSKDDLSNPSKGGARKASKNKSSNLNDTIETNLADPLKKGACRAYQDKSDDLNGAGT